MPHLERSDQAAFTVLPQAKLPLPPVGVLAVGSMSIEVDSPLVEPQTTRVKARIIFFRMREGIQFIAPNVTTGQMIQKGKNVIESLGFRGFFVFLLSKCPDHYMMSLVGIQC